MGRTCSPWGRDSSSLDRSSSARWWSSTDDSPRSWPCSTSSSSSWLRSRCRFKNSATLTWSPLFLTSPSLTPPPNFPSAAASAPWSRPSSSVLSSTPFDFLAALSLKIVLAGGSNPRFRFAGPIFGVKHGLTSWRPPRDLVHYLVHAEWFAIKIIEFCFKLLRSHKNCFVTKTINEFCFKLLRSRKNCFVTKTGQRPEEIWNVDFKTHFKFIIFNRRPCLLSNCTAAAASPRRTKKPMTVVNIFKRLSNIFQHVSNLFNVFQQILFVTILFDFNNLKILTLLLADDVTDCKSTSLWLMITLILYLLSFWCWIILRTFLYLITFWCWIILRTVLIVWYAKMFWKINNRIDDDIYQNTFRCN